jgi:hypothetical protein
MAVVTAGTPGVRPAAWTTAAAGGPGAGAPAGVRRTLGTLRRLRILLAVGALVFGAAAVWSIQVSQDGADDARSHSGPLTVQAESLYHNLSDADATAATIYLQVGQEPAALDDQYHQDLSRASAALTAATALTSGDQAMADTLQSIGDQLHQYIELNATAAANNLQGFPVGLRYLHQASNLMQTQILPLAQKFSQAAADDLAGAQDTAKSGYSAVFVTLGVFLLLALLVTQVRESRRTHRLFNPGLLVATGALLVTCAWLLSALFVLAGQENKARTEGSEQVSALGGARIDSLQARTDEMQVLVGRGVNDSYMDAYKTDAAKLKQQLDIADQSASAAQEPADAAAAADQKAWNDADAGIMQDYLNNHYDNAVHSAIAATGKATNGTNAYTPYNKLQQDLDTAIARAEAAFHQHAADGSDALLGAEAGAGVLALVMVAGVVVGLGRRIAEYS